MDVVRGAPPLINIVPDRPKGIEGHLRGDGEVLATLGSFWDALEVGDEMSTLGSASSTDFRGSLRRAGLGPDYVVS